MFVAVVGWQVLAVPRVSAVTPGPDSYVKNPSPTVVLDVKGLPKLRPSRVTFDGDDVTAEATRDGDNLTFTTGASPTARTPSRSAPQAPTCSVTRSARTGASPSTPASPRSSSPARPTRAASTPRRRRSAAPPSRYSTVTVVGGASRPAARPTRRQVRGQRQPARRALGRHHHHRRQGGQRDHQAAARVRRRQAADAQDDAARQDRQTLRPQDPHQGPDQLGEPKLKLVLDGESATLTGPPSRAVFTVKNLAQGKHIMVITAATRAATSSPTSRRSSSTAPSTSAAPACGRAPAARTSRSCREARSTPASTHGPKTGVYDADTEVAVKKFQAKYGLDGRRPRRRHGAQRPQRPDRRRHRRPAPLPLPRRQARQELPGRHRPAGLPHAHRHLLHRQHDEGPHLAAAQLRLGQGRASPSRRAPRTRSAPAGWAPARPGVGIHGVPPSEDGSIGTYASHGCIRMHNWDAVDLFDRVVIGMPVIIRQ